MDGDYGNIFINPEAAIINEYNARKKHLMETAEQLQKIIALPSSTVDGFSIQLEANISSLKELDRALQLGAAGVGLFRTEFLYMDRRELPSEQEQFAIYCQAAEKLAGKPLIIRTFDIGGDKQLDYFSLPEQENPSLGYRAIRISLDHKELFKTQLSAIVQAAFYGNVKIMYPMITSIEELHIANEILQEVKDELKESGKPYKPDIEVGAMIEVPAAAAISDLLAKELDFFSIGTNDLVQYILAVDRMNEKIAHMYDPYHPAILRTLKQIVESAHKHNIHVGVCGEMAGQQLALPFWISLGVHQLSMSVQSLLPIKNSLIQLSKKNQEHLLAQIWSCSTSQEIKQLLQDQINQGTQIASDTP
ncbi:MAG: phosphoenolpyruvate--protein phosphotransferase [Paenibacillus sp. RIFOXYA1_FULL_44_5]|nr:MAG: phosphoenolpyruvate--protein phosphotransferase [Paenibacillus sp. RIFOXYA1_FULL_44_5]